MTSAPFRLRLFVALAAAVLFGALATGLYAVGLDGSSLGFAARLVSVAPKALVLSGLLLPVAALGAAIAGRRLARPFEQLAESAGRMAQGEPSPELSFTQRGEETRRIAGALASLQREVLRQPYSAAFLRDAWHDLKTPLAAIRATLEVLEDGALDDPAASRRFVANIGSAADQLDRTLSDLVTLARFETAAVGPSRRAPLAEVVTSVLAHVEPLAEATRVAVRASASARPGADLPCDAAALTRALTNLLENAIRATPGGRVDVEVGALGRDVVSVDVANEPAEIPREVRGRLFHRAATARAGPGSGLGLAIARAAIEAHGGRVRFLELGPPRVRVRIELPR